MHLSNRPICMVFAAVLISATAMSAQFRGRGQQPESVRQGQQLIREGKLDEALAYFHKELEASPDSEPLHNATGVLLDLMGRGNDARSHFSRAVELAPTPEAKANAERAMAMSYAFSGDCANTVKHEQQVFDYYVSTKDFYQQGEIADEAARVCIDAGDLDTAARWYQKGHDAGLQEPGIAPDRVALWNYRLEHALARIAARRGNKAEAQKHVAAARELLDKNPDMARQQEIFFPYLAGYVAFYGGDYQAALEQFQKANQNDPFIQCLMGDTYAKLGDHDQAMECYRKAASTTAHNPPAAYARPYATKKLASD